MPDFDFQFEYAPDGYADRVQRAAVLYPLTRMCFSEAAVLAQTARLVGKWRARLHNLHQYAWTPGPATGRMQFARNCCPSFAYSEPRARPCHAQLLCPFCYARWVRQVWVTVEGAFHGPGQASARWVKEQQDVYDPLLDVPAACDHQLVERHLRSRVLFVAPHEDPNDSEAVEAKLRTILSRITSTRGVFVRKHQPTGAFMFMTLEPSRQGWRLHSRQLLMFPQTVVVADALLKETEGRKVFVYKQTTRRTLLGAVARVCRYPKLLLVGDPVRTATLLTVKQAIHARLSATYGVFRGGAGVRRTAT